MDAKILQRNGLPRTSAKVSIFECELDSIESTQE